MFVLDSFVGWVIRTITTAAEAELNDESALREQLLEAEMRREMGEISDEAFAEIESDLFVRIREIKARRRADAEAAGERPFEAGAETRLRVEADVTGEFHGADERPDATPPSPPPRPRRKIRS